MLDNLYFIELITSELIFYPTNYGEDKIKKVARIITFPINLEESSIKYFELQKSEIVLADSIVSVGTLIQEVRETFKYHQISSQALPRSLTPLEINFSLSLNLISVNRSVYNALDFLGDIGGLFGAIRAIFGGIIVLL